MASLHLYCFTEFAPDQDMQYNVGFSLILLICLNILVNILCFMGDIVKFLKKVTIKWFRRANRMLKKMIAHSDNNITTQTSDGSRIIPLTTAPISSVLTAADGHGSFAK